MIDHIRRGKRFNEIMSKSGYIVETTIAECTEYGIVIQVEVEIPLCKRYIKDVRVADSFYAYSHDTSYTKYGNDPEKAAEDLIAELDDIWMKDMQLKVLRGVV